MLTPERAKKVLEITFGAKLAADSALTVEDAAKVLEVLATLTPREERIMRLRAAGQTFRAISEDIGRWRGSPLSHNAVMMSLRKARRKLCHESRRHLLVPILNKLEIVG